MDLAYFHLFFCSSDHRVKVDSLSPCMLLSNGRELVGKLGPVDDGDDDYEKKDTDIDDNDDNNNDNGADD